MCMGHIEPIAERRAVSLLRMTLLEQTSAPNTAISAQGRNLPCAETDPIETTACKQPQ